MGKKVKLEPPANIEWRHISSDNKSEAKVVTTATNPVTSGSKIHTASIPVGTVSQSLSRTPGGLLKPIKVKSPEPFKGGTGTEAKQWAARMSGWLCLSATQFESDKDVVTFLLVNMEGATSSWALSHLANITTVDKFDAAFKKAFFDPDKQRAAERKITTLAQTTTTAAYTTEFCTLLMSLDWNKAALRAQFYKGLHWHVKQHLAQKESQPQDLEELISAAIWIDNVQCKLEISRPPRESHSKSASITTTVRSINTGTPQVDSD
ncbi:hypothetical protein RSOLAG1IB_11543 [Rhizoctonia solani AG-1 IB]|nr:hypothetical protein RSOLAG1IB_11543 [Rhizoctonia solani AG-1 IB]